MSTRRIIPKSSNHRHQSINQIKQSILSNQIKSIIFDHICCSPSSFSDHTKRSQFGHQKQGKKTQKMTSVSCQHGYTTNHEPYPAYPHHKPTETPRRALPRPFLRGFTPWHLAGKLGGHCIQRCGEDGVRLSEAKARPGFPRKVDEILGGTVKTSFSRSNLVFQNRKQFAPHNVIKCYSTMWKRSYYTACR